MAFLADGTMFFTERPGPVKVRLTNGAINTIGSPGDVAPAGEAGMMGLAVDPSFVPIASSTRAIRRAATTA
jgi:hypothetical protein